ncbi:hypothetical protein GSI_07661 [Ganoderma sinense ZZ0214-1]|uniref:Uncharacterized protein n=1 Tax=Ganoderma sinense ZZ0214-1 TaxID=1077348 RepID=A0A2G8S8L1_9APHY|nr:hypothetical protein GSI_07661 [Ganoderma sinense ZZ0214-1]
MSTTHRHIHYSLLRFYSRPAHSRGDRCSPNPPLAHRHRLVHERPQSPARGFVPHPHALHPLLLQRRPRVPRDGPPAPRADPPGTQAPLLPPPPKPDGRRARVPGLLPRPHAVRRRARAVRRPARRAPAARPPAALLPRARRRAARRRGGFDARRSRARGRPRGEPTRARQPEPALAGVEEARPRRVHAVGAAPAHPALPDPPSHARPRPRPRRRCGRTPNPSRRGRPPREPRPRLKLTLRYRRDMFDGVFTPELAARLSRLTLCLVCHDDDSDGEDDTADVAQLLWGGFLNTLISALRPLHNLTHLRLVVHCKLVKRPAGSATSLPYSHSESFVDTVRGPAFDFAGTADALVRTLPSLQYVFLTTCGSLVDRGENKSNSGRPSLREHERWNVGRAWRVANADLGQPQGTRKSTTTLPRTDGIRDEDEDPPRGRLVELHSDVSDTIIRNEELVLSDADESLLFPKDEKA